MAQFGASCPDLLENIQVLLARCQMDSDDEVRDRATYYINILSKNDKTLYNHYILDTLQISIPSLEKSLKEYIQNPSEQPFDIKSVPIAAIPTPEETEVKHKMEGMLITQGPVRLIPVSREENFTEKLSIIPGIQELGSLFKSSETIELTESETEYFVRCIKHCYANHMVSNHHAKELLVNLNGFNSFISKFNSI